MPNENAFVEDVMHRFNTVISATCRKMFGGFGVFHDGIMFALIADNELYLKTDKKSVCYFDDLNLSPFNYKKAGGREIHLSYYLAPEAFFEQPEETSLWTLRALNASRRAAATKK